MNFTFPLSLSNKESKEELLRVEFAVYVMQDSNDLCRFRAGAIGINLGKNNAWARLKQLNAAKKRAKEDGEWRYIFLQPLPLHINQLCGAEAILYGKLCEAFTATRSSGFRSDNLENVKKTAQNAVDTFIGLPQYIQP